MSHHSKRSRILYDDPSNPPQTSLHWKRLMDVDHKIIKSSNNGEVDTINGPEIVMIHSHTELLSAFRKDVTSFNFNSNKENYTKVAIWSCIIGYCEALLTHKDESRRYALFPIPIKALRHLVLDEFLTLLENIRHEVDDTGDTISFSTAASTLNNEKKSRGKKASTQHEMSLHRRTLQTLSNAIWKRAQSKKTSLKDELHANSLYVCFRGDIDNKSLDCFCAAMVTVIGMNILGFDSSCLTLSEDHAYESHWENGYAEEEETRNDCNRLFVSCEDSSSLKREKKRATCEVAIPGNNKSAQSQRGKEISEVFAQISQRDCTINTESSWLYMASNPIICKTPEMVLAAILANVNCDVEKQMVQSTNSNVNIASHILSNPLYKMKRDFLWVLHDAECLSNFPFALMELGECEEHVSSDKGMKMIAIPASGETSCIETNIRDNYDGCDDVNVLWNEKLFLDAIFISRDNYGDSQIYPYLYAGHYHKDAGGYRQEEEYRLVEAIHMYSEGSRVASRYKYNSKDCMQLMKHMTTVAALIYNDVLFERVWICRQNGIAAATWVIGFFDSLLLWEENEENSFVEILKIKHKHFLAKLFQLFPLDIRLEAFNQIHSFDELSTKFHIITRNKLMYFNKPRSQRLSKDALLTAVLSKEKIIVRDLDMALPSNVRIRNRKRTRLA